MARTIFLFLVLCNVMAFAWIYLKGEERNNAGREPQRTKSELAAARIRLLIPSEGVPESCRAYAGATVVEAQAIAKSWAEKLPAAHIEVLIANLQTTFDMAMIGLPSRAAAEIKIGQLKNLGITEGAHIRAVDDEHFEVLLGSFTARGAADDALESARNKGVRSAVIVERQATKASATIEIRGDVAVLEALEALTSSQQNGLAPVACTTAGNSP